MYVSNPIIAGACLVFIIFRYVAYISLFSNLSHVSNLILMSQIRSKFLIIFLSLFERFLYFEKMLS